MGLFSRRSDAETAAAKYEGRESASSEAARKRREGHRNRVIRDGDKAGQQFRGHRDWT
ncbi:hypothetical protein [Streptomyces sp. NPDC059753]|uniref:hypothetical protein n=1 Tax=Streptomyces sp. NPDC059753 TaxID=3346933 RepID=UPI0036613470